MGFGKHPGIAAYLDRIARSDFRTELGPVREMAALCGDPQRQYKTIHIAGTNGKGSTAAFLESLLRAEGLRVGLYTSPHIVSIRERIQVNRNPISEADFVATLTSIRRLLPRDDFLSYFEMTTLIAFEFFRQSRVDVAVIETGLGGRFDATNILKPSVTILTPISFDHQHLLGNSLSSIAREKCGILKRGIPVVSAPQTEEAARVIQEEGESVVWADPAEIQVSPGLPGEHQKSNAATAMAAARIFLGKKISQEPLRKTRWPGRLEIVSNDPLVLCDAAHNLAGIQTLADFLERNHRDKKKIFAIGVLKNKDWNRMFRPLTPFVERCHVLKLKTERALDPDALGLCLKSLGWRVESPEKPIPPPPPLRRDEMLVVCGSIYAIEPWYVSRHAASKTS